MIGCIWYMYCIFIIVLLAWFWFSKQSLWFWYMGRGGTCSAQSPLVSNIQTYRPWTPSMVSLGVLMIETKSPFQHSCKVHSLKTSKLSKSTFCLNHDPQNAGNSSTSHLCKLDRKKPLTKFSQGMLLKGRQLFHQMK